MIKQPCPPICYHQELGSPLAIWTSLHTAYSLLLSSAIHPQSKLHSHLQSSSANWKTHLFEKHVPLSSTYLYTILIKSPSPLPSSHGCTWYCPILTPLSLHKLYVFTLHVLILLKANRDISIFALCISSGPCGFYPQIVACDFGHLGAKAAQGTV